MSQPIWTVVVPIKHLDAAKSRLRGALPDVPHAELALALAVDTVGAVLACPAVAEVMVVTDDHRIGTELRRLGARIVPDRPGAGLNAAFRHGADAATARYRAGLTADLPALRAAELAAALAAATATGVRSFVADAPGTGTVLLTTPPGVPLEPRFGPGSAAAHAASGAVALTGAWPTLRRDVDTPADLRAATRLGLGPRSRSLVGGAAPTGGLSRRTPDRGGRRSAGSPDQSTEAV